MTCRPSLSRRALLALLAMATACSLLGVARPAPAAAAGGYEQVVDLTFPFESTEEVRFVDDYDHCRSGCARRHQSTDMMVRYGAKVHAVVGGRVKWVSGGSRPPSYGWMIKIRGDDGREYAYVHLGSQSGSRSGAYAKGIREGARVERGQHIGWAGCSGSASCRGGEHLHLEIHDQRVRDPYGYHSEERINPYPSLRAAQRNGDFPDAQGPFSDVPATAVHAATIEAIVETGITDGCGGDRFCPGRNVTRAQTATFVQRLLDHVHGDGFRLDATTVLPAFHDVDPKGVHAPAIEALVAAGVTRGCTTERFCPGAGATRRELAVTLARALDLPAGDRSFRDVPADAAWADEVAAVAEAGITAGCGNGRFCPEERVTRAQFAAFLVGALRAAG